MHFPFSFLQSASMAEIQQKHPGQKMPEKKESIVEPGHVPT
jgi:hypothetical protein